MPRQTFGKKKAFRFISFRRKIGKIIHSEEVEATMERLRVLVVPPRERVGRYSMAWGGLFNFVCGLMEVPLLQLFSDIVPRFLFCAIFTVSQGTHETMSHYYETTILLIISVILLIPVWDICIRVSEADLRFQSIGRALTTI